MPTDRTRRLLAAATATATTAGLLLAGAGGTATAQPTTTRGVWVDLPDDAIVVGADAGPSRSTLAVLYIVPNAVDAGIRETWLLMRSGGAWGLPRLLSDPTRDSYEHDLDVGSDGAVEVVWGEDVPGTNDDHMVVRRVAAGSVGPRREIPADPFNDPRIANGPGRTVVAWDQYDGGDLRVKAAIDAGSGFGAIETVSGTTAVWDGDSRVGDVSADTSVQVVMQRDVGGNHHAAWATRNLDDTWTRVEELPESYVATADVLPRVVADAASGDALLLHGHRVAGVLHHKATLFDADPLAIGPPEERLTAAVDLGPTANRSARGAILDVLVELEIAND